MSVLTWLGASAAQRRKWRQVGRQVPSDWRIRIRDHLKAGGVEVDFSEFDDLPPRPGKLASSGGAVPRSGGSPC